MRNDIDLDHYKRLLQERFEAITEQQESQKSGAKVELDQTRVGRLSRMDAMQHQAMFQAAARLTEQERQRIQSALVRINTGDYGYCIICDEEIAEGRLQFDPSILICIDCANEADGK